MTLFMSALPCYKNVQRICTRIPSSNGTFSQSIGEALALRREQFLPLRNVNENATTLSSLQVIQDVTAR